MNYNQNFNLYSTINQLNITSKLKKYLKPNKTKPIVLCIGSDRVLGDTLGPLVGTLLKEKYKIPTYVYGSLNSTITAKEIPFTTSYLKTLHPKTKIIAVDACVGSLEDIGKIKIKKEGLYPGLGVGKNLPKTGDVSILGILLNKNNSSFLTSSKLSLSYNMANIIANSISNFFSSCY